MITSHVHSSELQGYAGNAMRGWHDHENPLHQYTRPASLVRLVTDVERDRRGFVVLPGALLVQRRPLGIRIRSIKPLADIVFSFKIK